MENKYIKLLKKTAKPLGTLLSVISLIFIAVGIYRLGFDFGSIKNIPLFVALMLVGIVFKCFSLLLSAMGWADLLYLFSGGAAFEKKKAYVPYIKANIGKYLPGNVMHYVERNLFASGLGIGQKRIALTSAGEIILQITAALLMALIMSRTYLISAVSRVFSGNNVIYAAVLLGLLLIFVIALFVLRRRIGKFLAEFGTKAFFKTIVIALIKYSLDLWLLGVVMVMLCTFWDKGVEPSSWGLIISAYVIAWVLGFVTPGASGGIGVREIVIVFLLGPLVGEELILTLSVIHRLITIIGDFIMYFIVILTERINKSKEKQK